MCSYADEVDEMSFLWGVVTTLVVIGLCVLAVIFWRGMKVMRKQLVYQAAYIERQSGKEREVEKLLEMMDSYNDELQRFKKDMKAETLKEWVEKNLD